MVAALLETITKKMENNRFDKMYDTHLQSLVNQLLKKKHATNEPSACSKLLERLFWQQQEHHFEKEELRYAAQCVDSRV